jgi:predicted transcriptional regulator
MADERTGHILDLVSNIVSSYVAFNAVRVGQIDGLIQSVHAALDTTGYAVAEVEPLVPSTPIKDSVTRDHIFCLEDGMKFKALKRHLRTHHAMTPDDYRKKWDLPASYPMNAPSFSDSRSGHAKVSGLGVGTAIRGRGRPRKNA